MTSRWGNKVLFLVTFLPVLVAVSPYRPKPFAPDVKRKPGVYIEKWEGIDSYSIEKLKSNSRFPNLPTWRGYGTQFTQPENWGENFGARIRAYFVPKENGAHVFSISSDNSGELFLSNDESPKHKSLISLVREERFTKPKQYFKYIEQRSWPVQLKKGRYYYVETLMKEFYDKDHLSVAVHTPTKFIAPITSDYLWTALPDDYTSNQTMTGPSNIEIIKIAAKAGARAGASSGIMAATNSATKAGAEAGKMAGAQAGAMAGKVAAAAAAKSVLTNTFKEVLSSYKLGNLNFDIRLFGPNGEKIIKRYRNNSSIDNRYSTDLANNNLNHIVNFHLNGANGQRNSQNKNTASQESSPVLENHYLPTDTSTTNGNEHPNGNVREGPSKGVFGSSGQLLHHLEYVPIDVGHRHRQGQNGQRKSDGITEHIQDVDTQGLSQFTSIPLSSSSLSPDSRSSTPSSSEIKDLSSPHFETIESDEIDLPLKLSFQTVNHANKGSVPPVFTTIISEGTKANSIRNPGLPESYQSTRENEIFVYYPKPGEHPDVMARKLVYEGGSASKIVFDAHYSIHSLDLPALQLNATKNMCLNSFNGEITLRGQCQFFIVREGLLPNTGTDDISLESGCVPGHYLVQRNYKLYVDERDGTLHFAREATFGLYKTMSFPYSLQIMSFSHYMWFICESKNKNQRMTELHLDYVSAKESAISRCSFTFLPLPIGWNPKKNCKGVLNLEDPKIPGQHTITDNSPGIGQTASNTKETCVALNFVNKADIPFRLLSNIKQDRYLVTGKDFKLKTIIRRPDLHHHITYRAEDPTGKHVMLFYGDRTITVLPQHQCDEFVPVEVTAGPTEDPAKPPTNYHYHYHLPPSSQLPPPQALLPPVCPPSCSFPSSCSYTCPSHCCKRRDQGTNTRSVVPRERNGCICGSNCSPKIPNKTIKCYRTCQEICKEKEAWDRGNR